MTPQSRAGIVVDICTGCKGVWLDPGELDLIELHQNPANKNMPVTVANNSRGLLPPGESEYLFWRRLGGME